MRPLIFWSGIVHQALHQIPCVRKQQGPQKHVFRISLLGILKRFLKGTHTCVHTCRHACMHAHTHTYTHTHYFVCFWLYWVFIVAHGLCLVVASQIEKGASLVAVLGLSFPVACGWNISYHTRDGTCVSCIGR